MRVPALGALLDTHAVVHSRYRVHVVSRRRVVSEDAMALRAFARTGHVGRPSLVVVLDGTARLRACGREHWLSPGDFAVVGGKAGAEVRQDGSRGFLSFGVEWAPGELSSAAPPGCSFGRLAPADVETLRDVSRLLASPGVTVGDAAGAVARAASRLAGAGLPFERPGASDLVEEVPGHVLRLSQALDDVLSHLDRVPRLVDLRSVLGIGERQLHRSVTEYNARYGFNAGSWNDTRLRRQLLVGATLMTAPGATAERVAAAVGYGAARSFTRALAQAGLPSPSAIPAVVRGLA